VVCRERHNADGEKSFNTCTQAAATLNFTPNPWSASGSSPGGASAGAADYFYRFAATESFVASPGGFGCGAPSLTPPSVADRLGRIRGWAVGRASSEAASASVACGGGHLLLADDASAGLADDGLLRV
jgi:hypothetical protein